MTSRSLLLLLLVVLAAVATTRAAPQPQDAAHSRAKRFLLGWDLDDCMRRVQASLHRAWENSANLWRRLLGFAIQNHIKPGQAVVYQYVSPPGRAQVRIIDLKHGQHHGKDQERHEEPHEGVHKHGEHHEGVHKHGEHHEGVHKHGEHHEGVHEHGEHHEGVHKHGEHHEGVHKHGEHHEGVHKHGEHHEGVHKHGEHHEGGNDGGKRQEQSKSGEQSAAKKSKKGFNLHWDGEKLHFLVPGTHKYTSWLRVVENKHSHTVPLSEIAKHLANVKAGDLTAKIIGKKLSELQLELAVSGKDNKNTTIKIPLEKLIKESDKRNGEPPKNGKLIKLAQQELPSNVQKVPAAASRTVKEV